MGLSRSENMARIRGKNTEPERRLRSALWAAGLRYRLHARTPVGRPDVVFAGQRVAVFVDGCFWHGCPQHYVRPRSREGFWREKLAENVERDRQQTKTLEAAGWRVVRVWEHAVFETLEDLVDIVKATVAAAGIEPQDDWRVVRVEEIGEATNLERRFLERLGDPAARRVEEGPRVTAKWRRPAS